MPKNLAIYIHWPFCLSKCPYCDFNSRVMPQGEDQSTWREQYLAVLKAHADILPQRNITSIYFGGGTPSLMDSKTVEVLIDSVSSLWAIDPNCEITLEANPTSSEKSKFEDFKSSGVNRLSLGVQSLDDQALQFLGRTHDAKQARSAIESAAKTFDRYSFDLIYARAGQTLSAWGVELREALSFSPRHLSLYQLTLEEGSVFYKRPDKEKLIVTDDLAAEMFEMTSMTMEQAGTPAYEVSNYAQVGQESRHNMAYWQYQDYIGIGPGAHGRFVDDRGVRWASQEVAAPKDWLAKKLPNKTRIDHKEAMQEAFMMGLRLTEGIDKSGWEAKFGVALLDCIDQTASKRLEKSGLIANTEQILATTNKGRIFLNAITAQLFF